MCHDASYLGMQLRSIFLILSPERDEGTIEIHHREGEQAQEDGHGHIAVVTLSSRTKIFLYVKVLATFADSQPSLFTMLINKKDILTGAIYSKFKPRNVQLAP
jgi:hypothetical protein